MTDYIKKLWDELSTDDLSEDQDGSLAIVTLTPFEKAVEQAIKDTQEAIDKKVAEYIALTNSSHELASPISNLIRSTYPEVKDDR